MPITGQRVRVGGSGFTVFHWNDGTTNHVIAFARQVVVNGVTPVATPVTVQPLNAAQPVEIVTPGAHTNGVLTLTLTDLYNQAVWQRLAGLANSSDIIDIMRTIAARGQGIQISKIVSPPAGVGGSSFDTGDYIETYHDCVIASVADNETIAIDTMTVDKEIEVWYTYSRKNWLPRKYPLLYG